MAFFFFFFFCPHSSLFDRHAVDKRKRKRVCQRVHRRAVLSGRFADCLRLFGGAQMEVRKLGQPSVVDRFEPPQPSRLDRSGRRHFQRIPTVRLLYAHIFLMWTPVMRLMVLN